MKAHVIDHPNKVTRREIRKRGGKLFQDKAGKMYVITGPLRIGLIWNAWLTVERTGPRYWLAS